MVFSNGGIGVEEARICGLKWSLVYVLGVISVNGTKLEKVRKCENLISRKISVADCQIYTLQFSYGHATHFLRYYRTW